MMNRWRKISLFKFQQIDVINANANMSAIDKALFSTCIIFDLTEYQLDNTKPEKAAKLLSKVNRIFETDFNSKAKKRIGKYIINYDVANATFGQFIELSYFLTSKNPLQNAHYILASFSRQIFGKYNTSEHRKRADYFQQQSIVNAAGSMTKILEAFANLTKEYKDLFGLDQDVNGITAQEDIFNRRYGWIYSASQVAAYERITMDQAFALPVRQALNDLIYLKARAKYEYEQTKKK